MIGSIPPHRAWQVTTHLRGRISIAVLFLASGGALAGCPGTGEASGDPAPGSVEDLESACLQAVELYAENLEDCASTEISMIGITLRSAPGTHSTQAGCATVAAAWARAIQAGTVTFDRTRFEACLAAVRTAGPCGLAGDVLWVVRDRWCTGMSGRLDSGLPCRQDNECVEGLYCDRSAACPGNCTPRVGLDGNCPEFSFTDPTTWYRSVPCAGGLGCSFDGRCVPEPAAGEECGLANQGSMTCSAPLLCDFQRCRRSRPTGPSGACGTSGDADLLWCPLGSRCSNGTCVMLAAEGAPCDSSTQCADGLYCVDEACSPTLPVGAACVEDADCGEGAWCDEATRACTATYAIPDGGPCTRDEQCAGRFCEGGTCTNVDALGLDALCHFP